MSFRLVCDDGFAHRVDPSAGGIALAGVSGSGTSRAPYAFPATAYDLLLAMGRATAAIASPTLGRFVVSSHWSILRWYWAFDWSAAPTVTLSAASDDIKFHHRQAFSEALGLGVGLLIAERLTGGTSSPASAWTGGPLLVDVESFMQTPGKRPDLLILATGPGGAVTRVIVESKGNSGNRRTTMHQLRSGIEQSRALTGRAERIVVGACAPRTTFDAFGIRLPPDGMPYSTGPAGTATVDELATNALESERRRIMRFAGEEELTLLSPAGAEELTQPGALWEIGPLVVRGRRFLLEGDDRAVEITLGVVTDLLQRTAAVTSVDELHRARLDFARDNVEALESVDAGGDQSQRVALAADGCVLGVQHVLARGSDRGA